MSRELFVTREPQNERSRRTRAAILDAAWRLLEEKGGEGFTMEAVARRAGVTRRGVYLHFASRAELVLALHDHGNDVLDLQSSLGPVYEAPDAATSLDAFAEHLARFHRKILTINRAVVHGRHTDPDFAASYDQGMEAWLGTCRWITRRLSAEDRLAEPWTAETAADMLLALMRDEFIETLAVDRDWPEDQHVSLLAALFRRAFVRSADPGVS
jgi:AcrR family transcriptional regulator